MNIKEYYHIKRNDILKIDKKKKTFKGVPKIYSHTNNVNKYRPHGPTGKIK